MNMKPTLPVRLFACALAAAATTLLASPAGAQTTDSQSAEQVRATVLNLIRALVDQGVLPAGKAQDILRQAGVDPALLNAPQVSQAAPTSSEAPKPMVRVPYVPETVKNEIRDEVKQEVVAQARAERWGDPGTLPAWLSRVSFYGDLRLRYQRDNFNSGNDPVQNIDAFYQQPQGTTLNDTQARDRFRLRARLGASLRISETVGGGLRLATAQGDE